MPPVAVWARAVDEKLNNAATAINAATALDLILEVSNIISYPPSEDWEKIERLTNYGSVNRSQLLTCLLRFHRLTELPLPA